MSRPRARFGEPVTDGACRDLALRGGGIFARGDRPAIRPDGELFQIPARARPPAAARVVRTPKRPTAMHSDLDPAFEQHVRRQLRALPTESPPPFDWREFQRR